MIRRKGLRIYMRSVREEDKIKIPRVRNFFIELQLLYTPRLS
jgi:hypothetical protein